MRSSSLFLPDILPCPVPGRCDLHASIFGHSSQPDEIPKEWFCKRCQKTHLTTLEPSRSLDFSGTALPSSSSSSLVGSSSLESLPTELLRAITEYLPPASQALLAFSSHTLCTKLGTKVWEKTRHAPFNKRKPDKWELISMLQKDLPAYAPCPHVACQTLRPYDSAFAWPLLRNHREERGIKYPIYSLSQFFLQKLFPDCRRLRDEYQICPSLLCCSGTYRKPWAAQERLYAQNAGFSNECLEFGLPIKFEANARSEALGTDFPIEGLISHIEYTIELPQPWYCLHIAERFAILRNFYLCPHTLAFKLQPRDPYDPTYPSDSSIAHSLPSVPIPPVEMNCAGCSKEFQCSFTSVLDAKHRIVIDVWQNNRGRNCCDGFKEMVHCDSRGAWLRIKETFKKGHAL